MLFPELNRTDLVKLGIDIYYQRYHAILQRIKRGESRQISAELFNDPEKRLIQPMPGILIFLSLIKGWLGNEAGKCRPDASERIRTEIRQSHLTGADTVQSFNDQINAHQCRHSLKNP
jgi:hypothetical protein